MNVKEAISSWKSCTILPNRISTNLYERGPGFSADLSLVYPQIFILFIIYVTTMLVCTPMWKVFLCCPCMQVALSQILCNHHIVLLQIMVALKVNHLNKYMIWGTKLTLVHGFHTLSLRNILSHWMGFLRRVETDSFIYGRADSCKVI